MSNSQLIKDTIAFLSKDDVIITSGFFVGFFGYVGFNRSTLIRPLHTMFGASIAGFFCSIGARFVSVVVPEKITFIIPIVCMTSIAYQQYRQFKRRPI